MAREKALLGYQGTDAHFDITETFTHRQDTPDGRILRGDPGAGFWSEVRPNGCRGSWYGVEPAGWNPALAVLEPHTERYDDWWDVS